MSEHDDLIQQFSAVSGADSDRSKFFLESANWNLSTALSSYFEETGDDMDAGGGGGGGAAGAVEESTAQAAAGAGGGSTKPSRGAGALANVGGWSSNSDNSDVDEDDEDSQGQAFYAGGSEHSGQQVLGPPRKRNNVVAKLFKAAKEHGADVVEDSTSRVRSVRRTFHGTSYRLGETMDDTQVFSGGSSSSAEREPEPVELRMWRTGFTVGDGHLRLYEDEESMRFLKDIKNGRIPLELLKASGGREVAINLSDHHHEDYAQPKVARRAFTGQGQTLGSPAPSVVGQVTHVPGPGGSTHKPPGDPKQLEEDAKKMLNVDASQPTTSVQVRLNDGSRLVIRANHGHTVGDLRTYVSTARPEYSAVNFSLMTTFPHAELSQSDQTLTDAKLLNAAIVAKIK